jgi:hypothetical protein
MGNITSRFPSYAPTYGDFPQYTIWGESALMYFSVIITAFALATVTMMDSNGSSSSSSMIPAIQLPGASSGGKKGNNKKKH